MADGLRFRIREFRDELRTLQDIGASFFDGGAKAAFRQLEGQVDSMWQLPDGGRTRLEIDSRIPLRTRHCNGRYEHQGGGTFKTLHAVFTCVWDVRLDGPPSKKASGNRWFEIAGEASTVTELWVDSAEAPDRFAPGTTGWVCVASWRLEIGNMNEQGAAAPGPLFHAQMPRRTQGAAEPTALWPHWLSVPRLHALPFTPMLAIEFGLTEVFQEEWADHVRAVGAHGPMVKHWSKVQRERFAAFFDWQKETLSLPDLGTPLVGLKERGMPVAGFVGLG